MAHPLVPRRFRRPKAELRIELPAEPQRQTAPGPGPPADSAMGQVVQLLVSLLPHEPLQIRRGRLELSLLTTRFAPTTLDGYHEHTSAKVYRAIPLCENAAAAPGVALLYCAKLHLPAPPPADSRPARREWQAGTRFEVDGFRELRTACILRDVSPPHGGPPVVDGHGFLPL